MYILYKHCINTVAQKDNNNRIYLLLLMEIEMSRFSGFDMSKCYS